MCKYKYLDFFFFVVVVEIFASLSLKKPKTKETLWLAEIRIRHFIFVYSPWLKNMEVQASMELETHTVFPEALI